MSASITVPIGPATHEWYLCSPSNTAIGTGSSLFVVDAGTADQGELRCQFGSAAVLNTSLLDDGDVSVHSEDAAVLLKDGVKVEITWDGSTEIASGVYSRARVQDGTNDTTGDGAASTFGQSYDPWAEMRIFIGSGPNAPSMMIGDIFMYNVTKTLT